MNLIDARFSALLPQRAAGKDLVLAVLRAARGGDAAAPRQSQPAAAMPAWDDTRPVVFRSEAFAEDLLELA
jgi:hypothetical protein